MRRIAFVRITFAGLCALTVQALGEPVQTTIQEFNNPDGAKQWSPQCKEAIAGADRIKADVTKITKAMLYDNACVSFFVGTQQYWVREMAVAHSGAKSSQKKACDTVASVRGSGGTVETATMGAGEKTTGC